MYNFIDTNEASESVLLPSEALQINGNFIENLIPGYRTLNVSGREALSPELSSYETGVRDGSTLKSKRYPARTIVVTYQLVASSNEAFRTAYNTLAGILDVEEAELIFNDEMDKYYTGTPSAIGEVEPGLNSVTSEFKIVCVDPFKYSTVEYEVEPIITEDTDEEGNVVTAKTFVVEYNGTYKSHPTLEASFYSESETSEDGETEVALTGDGDCGFVAFFNENGKIIQLGDPDEADGADLLPKSQTIFNSGFKKTTSWGSAMKKLWVQNSGYEGSNIAQTGSLALVKSPIGVSSSEYYLKADAYGYGEKWHGPSITRTITADAAGDVGASDFTFSYMQKMAIANNNGQIQRGAFRALLVNGSGNDRKIVAGVSVFKSATGKKAQLQFYVDNKTVHKMDIDLSYNNKHFGNNRAANKAKKITAINTVKTSTITKTGKKVTFNIGGIKKTFTSANEAFVDMQVNEVTFLFGKYSTVTPLSYNGVYSAKFVKNNCTTWREIPNKFSTDDILIADCRKGEILLNNTSAPEYGALGNDWEDFYLQPGTNQIGVAYSDWVLDDFAPTFKMRYREVFL